MIYQILIYSILFVNQKDGTSFIENDPNEGRDFVQMYKSIAQEQIIDGFYFGPAPRNIEGRTDWMGAGQDSLIHAKAQVAISETLFERSDDLCRAL